MPGWEIIGEEERAAVNEVFDNGAVLFRHSFAALRNNVYKVREFERAFAARVGALHAQAVTSGTAALKVALEAVGVGPGDEVITQSHTFVATVEAILECGATPVITEVDWTLNMDPDDLARKITSRTKAIIPVHMLGVGARMDRVMQVASDAQVPVVEDAAQALGASFGGKMLGTIGALGCYSFDHGKALTTGEGGMVVTNDEALYLRARAYADHGHEDNPAVPRGEDTRSFAGFNFRMMELQGAIGLAQLEKLDGAIMAQRALKAKLKSALQSLPELANVRFRELPDSQGDNGDSVVFFLDTPEHARRAASTLKEKGVGFKNLPDALNWHFAGTWTHIFGAGTRYEGQDLETEIWPQSSRVLRTAIALPIFLKMDDARIAQVVAAVREAVRS